MKVKLDDSPTRGDVLKFLFESSLYGNLGLFIGSGFSKAIVDTDRKAIALGWGELLTIAGKQLKVFAVQLAPEGRLPESFGHQLRNHHTAFRVAEAVAPEPFAQAHGQGDHFPVIEPKCSGVP